MRKEMQAERDKEEAMWGAIAGDIIGSVYEWDNYRAKDFAPLFRKDAFFTDDSVHTVAIMEALRTGQDMGSLLQVYTLRYPGRGYGGMLMRWAYCRDPKPYNSFGNSSAMRVSGCGWWGRTEEEVLELARQSALPTHNHPEGVKGAEAVALAIWLARQNDSGRASRMAVRERLIEHSRYHLARNVDDIRATYGQFDVTCQGSVPEALVCALEGEGFEDAVRNAISIGGDSDTIAAIAGSVAEAVWGIPEAIKQEAEKRLDPELREGIETFERAAKGR